MLYTKIYPLKVLHIFLCCFLPFMGTAQAIEKYFSKQTDLVDVGEKKIPRHSIPLMPPFILSPTSLP